MICCIYNCVAKENGLNAHNQMQAKLVCRLVVDRASFFVRSRDVFHNTRLLWHISAHYQCNHIHNLGPGSTDLWVNLQPLRIQ